MTAVATLTSVEGHAIRRIDRANRVEGHPELMSRVFRVLFVSSFDSMFRWLGRMVTDRVVLHLDSKAERLDVIAEWLSKANSQLLTKIAVHSRPPSPELLEHIHRFEKNNGLLIQLSRENAASLRELNAHSRMAMAFDRLSSAAERLGACVATTKQITEQAESNSAVLAKVRLFNESIDDQLSSYGGEIEFDPELAKLAETALENMSRSTVRS